MNRKNCSKPDLIYTMYLYCSQYAEYISMQSACMHIHDQRRVCIRNFRKQIYTTRYVHVLRINKRKVIVFQTNSTMRIQMRSMNFETKHYKTTV